MESDTTVVQSISKFRHLNFDFDSIFFFKFLFELCWPVCVCCMYPHADKVSNVYILIRIVFFFFYFFIELCWALCVSYEGEGRMQVS